MTILALTRPDSWNFPLLVHIVGVVLFVGGVVTAACPARLRQGRHEAAAARVLDASRAGIARVHRAAHRRRVARTKKYNDLTPGVDDPTWLTIGYIVADLGALLLLASLIVGGIGVYRMRDGKGAGLLKATLALSIIIIAAGLVAVWAMAGKPN